MSVVQDVPGLILQLLSDVYEVVSQSEDMLDLEQGVHRLVNQTARELLEKVLQERDEELAEGRDKKALRMVGKRTRTLVTPVGEVHLKRAYYRDVKTGRDPGCNVNREDLGNRTREAVLGAKNARLVSERMITSHKP